MNKNKKIEIIKKNIEKTWTDEQKQKLKYYQKEYYKKYYIEKNLNNKNKKIIIKMC